jgi:superfamily II DNA or RNA helicase/diadenosine tetraphosphate (Ap4A) HIT family hydrolase/SOS-response transcriptional repressor LexA
VSVFAAIPETAWVVWNDLAFAIRDSFPVSPGHTLIVTRRVVADWFAATSEERAAVFALVEQVKERLDEEFHPDGYNVGFNAGPAAGQTVMHLHVHVIPRYRGDMDDPRGGVRGVIPSKQKYGPAGDEEPSSDPFGDLLDFVPGEEAHLLPELLHAMRRADRIDLLSAFVQPSGLKLITDDLVDALARGARVRALTGDYLGITHPEALQSLYTLSTEHPNLTVRFFESGGRAFHPKAYLFHRRAHGIAFVGSSNLSGSAVRDGVEWNLRTTSTRAPATFARLVARFDALFERPSARPLTAAIVEDYKTRVRVPPAPEPASPIPTPNPVQLEVLRLLQETREEGARRGLVVMATGLGKTYLAAFDFASFGGQRMLFLAHREEILTQAERAFSRVFPDRSRGLLVGDQRDVDADLLFGSVQTMGRDAHLRTFAPTHFDYIVVDEFHHASARTYRDILAHFQPRFLLGLTATPDRLDGASLLDLCDENLVARIGLVEGIKRKLLVPFRYFAAKDVADYAHIPWRSGRFEEEALTAAVATQERAGQALREYRARAPSGVRRTLAFCATRAHARFMAEYLTAHGVHAAAVYSGPGSAPRAETLAQFREGRIEVLCAVDVFNEGLDVPDVNTVLMLRPTESPVIFLQQVGRGLRLGDRQEKPALTVVDFIGNHRSFLRKPQALLALVGQDVPPGAALRLLRDHEVELPEGCSIEIETEALDLLERVSKLSKDDQLIYQYSTLRDSYGHRPRAAEVLAAGAHFEPVRQRYGTWHDFVQSQGDLDALELAVLEAHRSWFRDLLTTRMERSYKMIALAVMIDAGALCQSMEVRQLAERAFDRLSRDPILRWEVRDQERSAAGLDRFAASFRKMPLEVLQDAKGSSRRWFHLEGDRFVSELRVADDHMSVFLAMTDEVIELRLREYSLRNRFATELVGATAPIVLRVSHAGGSSSLRFDRARRADIPEGDVDVDVDGEHLTLAFKKIAVNVGTRGAGGPNVLPSRLRRWFGVSAGLPGTRHEVVLERAEAGWRLRPAPKHAALAEVIRFPQVPFFENLRAACGAPSQLSDDVDQRSALQVEASVALNPKKHFVVRAEGDSMDGGETPIHDGDLVLCEWLDATRPEEVEGKACLLAGSAGAELSFAQIKVPVRVGGRWFLRSRNAAFADEPLTEGVTLRPVARVLETVQPALGLQLWGTYRRDAIAPQFGQEYGREWQVGHVDLVLHGQPHTVLMVTLHKHAKEERYRYADRFTSPSEFEWESQNRTTPRDKRGRAIVEHRAQGRTIHLFVRFNEDAKDGKGEAFVYCGPVEHVSHRGEKPMQVVFRLVEALPKDLYRAWME